MGRVSNGVEAGRVSNGDGMRETSNGIEVGRVSKMGTPSNQDHIQINTQTININQQTNTISNTSDTDNENDDEFWKRVCILTIISYIAAG